MDSFYNSIINRFNESIVRSIQILKKLYNLRHVTFANIGKHTINVLQDPKNTRNFAIACLMLIVAVIIKGDAIAKCLNASTISNTEYCYSLSVNASNDSVSGYSYFDFPLPTAYGLHPIKCIK